MTTFGPGELSVVNGLAGAMAESVPIVSVVGGPTTEIMDRRAAMHHSLGDGDFDRWVRVAREVTVAQATLSAGNAPAEIDRVLRECWTRQRPVYLRLPGDVARQPVPKPPRRFVRPAPAGDPDQLDAFDTAAQRLLNGATCPAMLVGNLALRYGLGAEIAALLADRHWPAATQGLGRGLLDETGPNYVGVYNGGDSAEPVRRIIEEADVLVCVGTKFFDWDGLFTADLDRSGVLAAETLTRAQTVELPRLCTRPSGMPQPAAMTPAWRPERAETMTLCRPARTPRTGTVGRPAAGGRFPVVPPAVHPRTVEGTGPDQ